MAHDNRRLKFEWDADKARINLKKHGVDFEEASTSFNDPLAKLNYDLDHSFEEDREIIIGHSIFKRLMIVCFTERTGHRIRIISARLANPRERKSYEEDKTD